MGRALKRSISRGGCGLRKSLGSLFADEWGCVPALLVVWLGGSQNWRKEGREGRRKEGRTEGIKDGWKEGWREETKEGREEGRKKGRKSVAGLEPIGHWVGLGLGANDPNNMAASNRNSCR